MARKKRGRQHGSRAATQVTGAGAGASTADDSGSNSGSGARDPSSGASAAATVELTDVHPSIPRAASASGGTTAAAQHGSGLAASEGTRAAGARGGGDDFGSVAGDDDEEAARHGDGSDSDDAPLVTGARSDAYAAGASNGSDTRSGGARGRRRAPRVVEMPASNGRCVSCGWVGALVMGLVLVSVIVAVYKYGSPRAGADDPSDAGTSLGEHVQAPGEVTALPGLVSSTSSAGEAGAAAVTFKQFAGDFQVDAGAHGTARVFHWLMLSQDDSVDAPLLVWLGGWPACSGLGEAFGPAGPLVLGDGGSITANAQSWNARANVLYLDSPVGDGGFSHARCCAPRPSAASAPPDEGVESLSTASQTSGSGGAASGTGGTAAGEGETGGQSAQDAEDHVCGGAWDEASLASVYAATVRRVLGKYPHFATVPLHVGGNGVAARVAVHVVAALATEETGTLAAPVPVAGIVMVSPLSDPTIQLADTVPFLGRRALLPPGGVQGVEAQCPADEVGGAACWLLGQCSTPCDAQLDAASVSMGSNAGLLDLRDVLADTPVGCDDSVGNAELPIEWASQCTAAAVTEYLSRADVQQALHVVPADEACVVEEAVASGEGGASSGDNSGGGGEAAGSFSGAGSGGGGDRGLATSTHAAWNACGSSASAEGGTTFEMGADSLTAAVSDILANDSELRVLVVGGSVSAVPTAKSVLHWALTLDPAHVPSTGVSASHWSAWRLDVPGHGQQTGGYTTHVTPQVQYSSVHGGGATPSASRPLQTRTLMETFLRVAP